MDVVNFYLVSAIIFYYVLSEKFEHLRTWPLIFAHRFRPRSASPQGLIKYRCQCLVGLSTSVEFCWF